MKFALRDTSAEMNAFTLWNEWKKGFVSDGIEWKPLSVLEKERRLKKRRYFHESLETTIRRRREICHYIQRKSTEFKSDDKALYHTERVRKDLVQKATNTKKSKCSLYKLWQHICSGTVN